LQIRPFFSGAFNYSREFADFLEDVCRFRVVGFTLPGGLIEHGFALVNRREGQADQVLAGAEPAVAHMVKGVFEVVRKRGEGVKPEHRPRSVCARKNAARQSALRRVLTIESEWPISGITEVTIES
jgi:hypothetical protein